MTETQESVRHLILPIIAMASLFIIIHGIAVLIAPTLISAGYDEAMGDSENPFNLVLLFGIIGIMTGVILLLAKFGIQVLIKLLILFAVGYTSFILLIPLFNAILNWWWPLILPLVIAVGLVILLFKHPEWYIIDLCGIIVGSGAIAIFGISLGIFIIVVFLIGLMIYDAISVYKTKHMIDLADTVMDLKLPVLLVIPKKLNYSLIKETKRLKEQLKDKEERDAFFMGLGDVVMPGILVVAASQAEGGGILLALIVLIGTLIGFSLLMTLVIKGKPQAGLPLLCGGALAGYFIGSFFLTGMLVGFHIPTF